MGLKVDGIACSNHIDSSGESLDISGHDISDMQAGRSPINWEHGQKADDLIGHVIYARKILKKEDCENERQRYYWGISKKPFVYIVGELFDDEENPSSIAVAAMCRFYAKANERMLIGFSIEGATMSRDGHILKESVARKLAMTVRPCNKMAIAGLLEDPKAKKIAKSIEEISQSVYHHLIEVDSAILDDAYLPEDPILDLYKTIDDLEKTLTAGMANVAPGQMVGGAALAKENLTSATKQRMKSLIRSWDRKRPLKEVIKAALPEVSDEYLNHFIDTAEDLSLKKSRGTLNLTRIGQEHAHPSSNEAQKSLVDGLYHDPKSTFKPGHSNYTGSRNKKFLSLRNDSGKDVLLKYWDKRADLDHNVLDTQYKNAHDHYQAMSDVFGLGKYVPVVTHMKHPQINGGNPISAQELVSATTPIMDTKGLTKALQKSKDDGHVHKLVLANHILGTGDRHMGNFLVHPEGHLMSIDHDDAFRYGPLMTPGLMYNEGGDEPLHLEAAKWVKSIDPKALAKKLASQGHDFPTVNKAVSTLKYYQKLSGRPDMSIGQMFDHVSNHMTAMDQKKAV